MSSREMKKWIHPWNLPPQAFDNMDRDSRYFSIVIKGLLNWLDTNVRLYDKNIRHFIVQTGTEYLYQESNGYSFSWSETTGEDQIYMYKPRCTVEWQHVEVINEEITSPFARGTYERYVESDDEFFGQSLEVRAYNAEIRTIPLKLPIKLSYVLSKFNEQIILVEELLSLFSFTKYFSVSYLGEQFQCSVEFPQSITHASQVKLDYNAEKKDRIIEISIDLKCSYPVVLEHTDIDASNVILSYAVDPQFIKTYPAVSQEVFEERRRTRPSRWKDGSTGNIYDPAFDKQSTRMPGPDLADLGSGTGNGTGTGTGTGTGNGTGNGTGTGTGTGTGDYARTNRPLTEQTLEEKNKKDALSLGTKDPYDTKKVEGQDTQLSKEFAGKIVKQLEEGLELRFSDKETEVIERILLDND